jgi:hypothetical protein
LLTEVSTGSTVLRLPAYRSVERILEILNREWLPKAQPTVFLDSLRRRFVIWDHDNGDA